MKTLAAIVAVGLTYGVVAPVRIGKQPRPYGPKEEHTGSTLTTVDGVTHAILAKDGGEMSLSGETYKITDVAMPRSHAGRNRKERRKAAARSR